MITGFLLHRRPYRETSSLLSFFSDQYGRVDVVARASRGSANKNRSPLLQFSPYDLQLSGKGELRHLVHCETTGPAYSLQGQSLYCGLYINELLYRLLPKHECEPVLFQAYIAAMHQLVDGTDLEPCLRVFELALLDAIGYGLSLQHDVDDMPLDPERQYAYHAERGLVPVDSQQAGSRLTGSGESFLAIAVCNYARSEVRQLAKQLLRSSLALYLGNKPLQSRKLFGGHG